MNVLKGKTDDREWTLISFNLTSIRLMSADEKKTLTSKRTQVKDSRKKATAAKKAKKAENKGGKAA